MKKLFTVLFIGIPVFFIGYTLYDNVKDTIDTAKALKFSVSKVTWKGVTGSLTDILNAYFSIEVKFKIVNPTASPLVLDYIKMDLSIVGKLFAKVNINFPITINAKSTLIQPIMVKSATGEDFIALIHQVVIQGKIPTSLHMKGEASANTWKAPIDNDFSISDALSGHKLKS